MSEHGEQHRRIAVLPAELRHVLEVHAVEPEDHRRHGDDRHPARDLAQVLVVAHGELGEVGLQHAGEQLVERRDSLRVAAQVVVDVAEVGRGARVEREPGLVGGEALHRRDERRHRALELEHLALELVDPLGRVGPAAREDLGLDRVDLDGRAVRAPARSRRRCGRRRRRGPSSGPMPRRSGWASRSSRTSCSGLPSPWRTVTTKRGPANTMTSPISTGSALFTYRAVLSTRKSVSPNTSSFGRWWAWTASSTASGCSSKRSPTASTTSELGSWRPIQTKPSRHASALPSAVSSSTRPPCRRPSS